MITHFNDDDDENNKDIETEQKTMDWIEYILKKYPIAASNKV